MDSAFERAMAAFEPAHWPLAVGFSGGADSTALLAACAARRPGEVVAFHVHHGLQAAADDFERHCRNVCERLAVPLRVHRVDARHARGDSPEDAARRARYSAFAEMARMDGSAPAIQSIALGHHADDQIETLLLALSRGAGLPGLAAMPARAQRGGLEIHRPLLAVAGADIREWLAGRGLPWIEDPTNGDARYTRNRIRAVVLPALAQAFPQFRATFARSIGHAAQAQELLDELAAQDMETVGNPPRIATLQTLSHSRQANVLRHWMMQAHGSAPSAAQLDQLLSQVRACTTRGHRIHLKVAAGFIERKGDFLHWYNAPPSPKTLL
ncbi:tRNA(Ile)-lysidine synthetase [Variovorax paradoxus]|uniref:tRNA(Ile)-lysidine synthase n=1 Tax=Variovorax paradoxus TaxID=34073 RepID=A0AA91DI77_VARPD|nr:tRNA lysidine(34) synthetase TilS [Variovorax paradoxus]OAK58205.1 tRNA(Ile)-lysidine synthetase [Variovorax paradoxus]